MVAAAVWVGVVGSVAGAVALGGPAGVWAVDLDSAAVSAADPAWVEVSEGLEAASAVGRVWVEALGAGLGSAEESAVSRVLAAVWAVGPAWVAVSEELEVALAVGPAWVEVSGGGPGLVGALAVVQVLAAASAAGRD